MPFTSQFFLPTLQLPLIFHSGFNAAANKGNKSIPFSRENVIAVISGMSLYNRGHPLTNYFI
jgi:hypothetical protein